MLRSAFTLVALVSYASAQNTGLSGGCRSAVVQVISNPNAADCLAGSSLLSFIGSSGSIVSPIDNWISNMCKSKACDNSTLAGAVKNITNGCATDFKITSDVDTLTSTVQEVYPSVRKILCLKEGNNSCITQFLSNIQDIVGTISLSNVLNLVGSVSASDFPPNITCTNCNKAIYNVVNQSIPSVSTILTPPLKSECGASFIDGASTADVTASASNSIESSTSSASSIVFGGVSLLSHGIITGLVGISALLLLS